VNRSRDLDKRHSMRTGLLWFDDNPRLPIAAKIEKAARRYRERFGRSPNICYVHPQTLAGAEELPTHVQVVGKVTIQPDNFWIGVKTSRAPQESDRRDRGRRRTRAR